MTSFSREAKEMKTLDALIEARRAEMTGDLQQLVRVESVKDTGYPGAPFGKGIREALTWFLAKGQALGFAIKDLDGYAGHLEFGEGREIFGILVHLDVVPAGNNWTHPPFAGAIEGGRLYGRGTMDDKGPAVACLHALAALRDSGFVPRRRIRLILGCDEESGWECMEHYFATEERPIFGFSPDGEFPLIMAEKGQLGLTLKRRWNTKPEAAARITAVQGGIRANVVPENCTAQIVGRLPVKHSERVTLTESSAGFTLAAKGIAAHGSLPEKGDNAVTKLFQELIFLADRLPEEQTKVVRLLAEAIGPHYDGSGLGIAFSDSVSGPLTLNLGTISWDQTGVTCQVDIRYPVTADKEAILSKVRELAGAAGLEISVYNYLAPLHVPADHPLVTKLMKVFRDMTGSHAPPIAGLRSTASRRWVAAFAWSPASSNAAPRSKVRWAALPGSRRRASWRWGIASRGRPTSRRTEARNWRVPASRGAIRTACSRSSRARANMSAAQ